MKRIVCCCLAFLMLCALLLSATADGEGPRLYLTYTPVYGEKVPFSGYVTFPDGAAPSDYRVSLYLQLAEGETCWVKPYAESGNYHSYVTLSEDGAFSLPYVTGGQDQNAKILHIMIVPGDYVPGSDFDATRSISLDYLRVNRDETGAVSLSEDRVPQADTSELAADPGKPSGLIVSADKLAVNTGFYNSGNSPERGEPVLESDIRGQLTALAPYADTVRLYAAGTELELAYPIAAEMGFRVIGTAWLSGDPEADRAEMDALIDRCNRGECALAVVGSETLLRGDLTVDGLLADVAYVKAGITDDRIAVTTADSAAFFIGDPRLAAACDVLFVNIYPFWDGVAAEDAPAAFIGTADQLRTLYPAKELIISETGWPTAGTPTGKAVPGGPEAAAYFAAVREWSLKEGVLIVWFDGADEPWKASAEGDVGAHWGFLTETFELKPDYTELFR